VSVALPATVRVRLSSTALFNTAFRDTCLCLCLSGIIAAVAIASCRPSSTFDELEVRCAGALTYLFWHGARVQQCFPFRAAHAGASGGSAASVGAASGSSSVPAKIVAESMARGFGLPRPMLSVRGLTAAVLQATISRVNSLLDGDKHVHLSLVNGTACV
jgi:fatty acid synthase subunit beta, fungi type